MSSLSKFDRLGLTLCLLLIALFSYFYIKNNSNFNQRNPTDSIGQILTLKNSAQIKQSRDFAWADIQDKDYIQQNDSIFVGPDSEITIKFKNNELITLKENSMLSFNKSDSTFDIALKFGEINSEQISQKIEIDVCGKKELVDPSNAKNISIVKNNNCQIEIKAKSGQFQVAEKKISNLKQIDTSVILGENTYEISETSESSEKSTLLTTNNNNLLTAETLKDDIFNSPPPLPTALEKPAEKIPAEHKVEHKKNIKTPPVDIFLVPQISSDYLKKNFYSQDKNSSNLYLRWNNMNTQIQVIQSQIEISQNKNFNPLFLNETTDKNSILLKNQMNKGSYFWRVRFKSTEKYSDWSAVAQLSIF
jgi:hypothetical protein